MTTTTTEVEETTSTDIFPYEDIDDGKDHLTHVVNPDMNRHIWEPGPVPSAQDVVDTARLMGYEVVALCGYRWVPMRNPEKYPVCQPCMDIAGQIMRGE